MTGGILLAHEVGKALGTRAIFTERENGKMTLRRGFQIPAGTRVLVVEDIVTTGGSVKEVMEVVKEHGGELVGVGLLVDRSGGKVDFGVRTEALLHLNVETFDPATCPLCAKGVPFTKRGRLVSKARFVASVTKREIEKAALSSLANRTGSKKEDK